MKKIILIFIILFPLFAWTQNIEPPITKKLVNHIILTRDSTFVIPTPGDYIWRIDVGWSSNNATTSSIKIQSSIRGLVWNNYARMDTVIMSTAAGTQPFEDCYTSCNYLGICYRHQTGKVATLDIWYTLKQK